MINKEDHRRYLKQALIVAIDEITNARINVEAADYDPNVSSELHAKLTKIRDELWAIKDIVKRMEPV